MFEVQNTNSFSEETETESPEVHAAEETSTNTEDTTETNTATNTETNTEDNTRNNTASAPKKKRTRRPTPPGAELLMQAMRERQKYKLENQEDRDQFMFDLMDTAGDAILNGEVFCDNRDVMIKLLAVCFLKEDFAEKH